MGSKEDDHDQPDEPGGSGIRLSRRGFMKSWGAGFAAVAVNPAGALEAKERPDPARPAGEAAPVTLNVNGRPHQVLAEPRWTLLHVLREHLGLTAAKIGCGRGECGSCTVLMDDIPRYACLTLAVEAEGRRIETAEGLMDGEALGSVQRSFVKEDGLQCGYCTPGQVMTAEGLLRRNPNPSFDEIRGGMSGNLCRCGAYAHIFNAVADAARNRKG
ncbi:MAG: (2Fe-2S)-binding protein [Gammaproteobacteria bacterium]|nr:(2Fe-2S)-binding protein [Gammaproteobacteria bacterium]NIR96843.1 (2Fe-2S)-binding protein [Gammaproteobacteria bacterium]NIT62554.1 (2Fe-2S)-binding protein [Gammaproteobacteria bacterium]NIV19498.1 2Fe-2S iron-sulfur cluster binding domain-containing protein [Gammaproteobacteria bacterium]NIY31134.1 2Fe-2S iron-sulfur cluster binding domain-containing protein [Gammaproteobacteria bacterium]